MKIEIRERKTGEKLLALERHGVGADGESNFPGIGAFELRRLERFHILDRLRQPLLQFLKRRFSVGGGGHFAVRQPRAAFCREIADELDLLAERQHVRKEPRAEQHVRRNIFGFAVRLGLGEDAGEAAENLQERRNGSVIKGHGMLFSCCGISLKMPRAAKHTSYSQPAMTANEYVNAAAHASAPAVRRWAMNRRAGRI